MAQYKSNGFRIGGKTFPTGANLSEKDFPTEDHIKLCIGNGNVVIVDENVADADFDEYDGLKVDELKALLIESGKTEEELKGLLKADLIELLREEKDDEK